MCDSCRENMDNISGGEQEKNPDTIRTRGRIEGFLFAFLLVGCALAGWRLAAGRPYKSVLSDRNRRDKLEVLEQMVDKYYLWDKDQDKMAEGLYLGLMYGLGDP